MLIFSPRNIASIRVSQPAFLRQANQQPQRLVGDAVLRIIEVDAGGLGRQALAALRDRGKQLAEVQGAKVAMVLVERLSRPAAR